MGTSTFSFSKKPRPTRQSLEYGRKLAFRLRDTLKRHSREQVVIGKTQIQARGRDPLRLEAPPRSASPDLNSNKLPRQVSLSQVFLRHDICRNKDGIPGSVHFAAFIYEACFGEHGSLWPVRLRPCLRGHATLPQKSSLRMLLQLSGYAMHDASVVEDDQITLPPAVSIDVLGTIDATLHSVDHSSGFGQIIYDVHSPGIRIPGV